MPVSKTIVFNSIDLSEYLSGVALLQKFLSHQLARPSGWFGRFFTSRWLEKINVRMNALALECLNLQSDDRVLEIGFGSGSLLDAILKTGKCHHVAGLELSTEMIAFVNKRLAASVQSQTLQLAQGRIDVIPFASSSFSKVVSVNTLYFWTDTREALRECARVLREGGQLVLCYNAKQDMQNWPGHVHGFTLYETSEVENLLRDVGFVNIQTRSLQDPVQGLVYSVVATWLPSTL
jgi:ubiquinone/menaquinone biosynthesis C-methylase UbiE